ncbi:hypothetical protein KSP40_PGU019216 [Platanthera guangdongensis]|uniref:PEHE domain-containing protein n=1 Tax=Platanthera guangdongensis TaxID=2320717 RepID=A0ABR2MP38_9ASPA
MSPHSMFQVQANGLIWKAEEEPRPAPASVTPETGQSEHTMLEREVAEIIISLLHQTRRSDSGRRFRRLVPRAVPSDLSFPKWGVKRKRSIHTAVHARTTLAGSCTAEPLSISFSNTLLPSSPSSASKENSGFLQASPQKSSKTSFLDTEPKVVEAYFKTEVFERGLLFWPGWRENSDREYGLPDLNMSAEELAEDELWRRRQQHVLYEIGCRRLAAADARRKRRELQKLKNSINAGAAPFLHRF